MQELIYNKLRQIEKEYGIKILYACESGSRAWEFPSPDSDYDVRFIYCRPLNAYLTVAEKTDHLSFPINDELDIYGWDLSKVLQLIRKSNTTPFEWLQSPIVYFEEAGFREELMHLCGYYYSQRSNTHHYLGIARGAMETMHSDGTIKIKKLFYVLRPLLAAKWCLERNTIAPMSIKPLMAVLPQQLKESIAHLILQKASAPEGWLIQPVKDLMDWINETEQKCIAASGHLAKDHFTTEHLDTFFRKTIHQYDYTTT